MVDASGHALDDIRSAHPEVVWIDYPVADWGRRTIAGQRNEGVRVSRGDVVVFLDSGCLPEPAWFANLLDPITNDGESIVAGRISSHGHKTLHDANIGQSGSKKTYIPECATMNLAVSKSAFERIGLFDERIGFAEDVDFAWRAGDCGIPILFQPAATVRHDWGTARQDYSRAFRYGVARVRLLRKHPNRVRTTLLGRDGYIVAYCGFIVLLPLTLVVPWYPLLLMPLLARNWHNRPLATVSYHLVYALGALSELFHLRLTTAQRAARTYERSLRQGS